MVRRISIPARQNEVVEGWITRGVDVIAVSVENKASISTALRKARSRGIKVIAWDADAEPDARDFLINQATPQGIGETLADGRRALLGGTGDFAIVTASLSAANQNEWMRYIRARLADKYPGMHWSPMQPSDGDRDRAFSETQTILKVHPSVRVIMGIAAPAVPGAAEAVRQSGRTDVKVIGLSLPNMCKPYVQGGRHRQHRALEHPRPRLSDRRRRHALASGDARRPAATALTRAASAASPSQAIRCCSGNRSCSRRTTSTGSTSRNSPGQPLKSFEAGEWRPLLMQIAAEALTHSAPPKRHPATLRGCS